MKSDMPGVLLLNGDFCLYSLAEVARLFGHDNWDDEDELARWFRRLVAECRLPRPITIDSKQFYTSLDVAIILHMAGRWGPADAKED